MLFASAKSNIIFDNEVTLFLLFSVSWAVMYKKRIPVTRAFFVLLGVFFVYSTIYLFKFSVLNVTATLRFFLNLGFAYAVIRIAAERFYEHVETWVYKLALISLPLYLVQVVAPKFMLTLNGSLAVLLPFMKNYSTDLVEYTSSVIFSFNYHNHMYRNSGFMWEPGAFGAVLGMVILINLIRSRFTFNRKLAVLLVTVITTFSTTAFILLGFLLLFYMLNKGRFARIMAPVMLIPIGFLIWQFEFVGEKIEHQFNTRDDIMVNEKKYFSLGYKSRSLGRFGSLVIDLKDLSDDPVFGTGFQYEERTQGKLLTYEKTNGLSDYLVKFGILGMVLFIFNISRSFNRYGSVYNTYGVWLIPVIVVVIGFSNPVLFTPLFLSFQVYYIARPK
ncbi:MAG: hypothetical protein V4543_09950 [Bacteroidota bacterium]